MDVSRYSFPCQKALHQGLQFARSYGHQHLEVEHIALALLRSDALEHLSTHAIESLQLALEKQLAQLPKFFGEVKVEFGTRLDVALDLAEREQGDEPVSAALLWKSLLPSCDLLQRLLPQLTQEESPSTSSKKVGAAPSRPKSAAIKSFSLPEKLEKVLEKYTIDLTALAERNELDPVIGRDIETRRVMEILGRKKKNNPVLIGQAGVGKTAVVECLAQRIVSGAVPESMRGKRVLSLDMGSMVAGAKFRGEFEERMGQLMQAIQACSGNIILFIDELHTIVGAGRAEGSADAANLLKPALARGELHCLGATTFDEYRKYIEKDPALERRFQAVVVAEPSRDNAISILRGLKSHYQIFHGVQVHDDALVSAVDLSIRFLSDRRLPDKAIDLLDEACSRVRIQIDSVPAVMDQLQSQIAQLEIERKTVVGDPTAKTALGKIDGKLERARVELQGIEKIWRDHQLLLEQMRKLEKKKQEQTVLFETSKGQGNFDLAARLQNEEMPRLEKEMEIIRTQLQEMQKKQAWLRQVVGSIEIADVISAWSSIPLQKVMKEEGKSVLGIEQRLAKRIFGQKDAILRVSKALKRTKVGIQDPNRPLGVFLFVGPTGVGKTEMVKALAEEMFDNEKRMVRLDMSEFMEQHSVARLIGSPPGYVGSDDGGELTEAVRRTPYTVVLFDEIEKAHPKVLDILLQVFEDGRLTDSKGHLVDFRNVMIIMTSNLLVQSDLFAQKNVEEETVRGELAKILRPEFVGRIDEVVIFHKLGRMHIQNLLEKLLSQLNTRLTERQLRIVLGSAMHEKLIQEGMHSEFGGRTLRRAFQRRIIDPVSEWVLQFEEQCSGVWCMEWGADGKIHWYLDYTPNRYLPAAS